MQRQPTARPELALLIAGLLSTCASDTLTSYSSFLVTIWPVTGILAALLLTHADGRRWRQLFICVAGGAGILIGGLAAGIDKKPAALRAGTTIINLFILGFFLIPHVRTFEDLRKRQNVLRLMIASTFAPLVSGVLCSEEVASIIRTSLSEASLVAAMGDILGIALLLPVLLLILTGESSLRSKFQAKPISLVLSLAFFILDCSATFWQTFGPYLFIIFPALLWLLLVAGLEGAIFASLFVTVIGSVSTAHGHGPVSLVRSSSPGSHVLTFQIFILVCIVTALPIGAAIDERNRVERIASNAFSIQRAILRYTREAIVLSSLDGKERYASPGIERLTGWTSSEYVGLERLQTVHAEDRDRVRHLLESLQADVVETTLRYRNLHKDGTWTWVEASISIYGDEGRVDGYVGTIRDITRLIEAEQGWIEERRSLSAEQKRLVEAEQAANYQLKLRDEFLSHVSHELRSPLTSIYSFTSIVVDGLAGVISPQQHEYLGIVLKNVQQLQAMIEDLLTVTKSSEGKLAIELQAASLSEAVSDSIKTLAGFAQRKSISVSEQAVSRSLEAYADPVRLRQILIILLDNAVKFTPEGGTVQISVARKGDHVLTQVIDTGVGVPEEQWKLVFDKLYQIDGPANRDTSISGRTGLGLGLHIARSLVARQSGHIWVTSVPNQGSTFQFTLPLYQGQDA